MMRHLAFGLVAAACGCGSAPAPKVATPCAPQTISVRLLGSDRLNATNEGEARPLVTRLYRLKSDSRLDRVAFDQLWHDDKAVLAEDLVKVDEVQLFPGTRADLNFPRDPAVQTLVAIGLFQSPRGRTWLYAADLPPLPEPGRCSPTECAPDDDECRIRANANPVIAIYFDAATVDDGTDQAADYPNAGPRHPKTEAAPKGPTR